MNKLYNVFAGLLFQSCCMIVMGGNPDPFTVPERGFSSWLPAQNWENALITGNGIMGSMVMGQPHDETIILNQAQLYLPSTPPMKPIQQAARLQEIRQLILDGKYDEAGKIPVDISTQEGYGGLRWTDPYIPAFDIRVIMDPANVKHYMRKVNFANAETTVAWEDTRGTFQKRLFVSRADNVVVLSIKGSGKINCHIGFDRHPIDWQQWSFINSTIGETSWTAKDSFLVYRSEFKKHWVGSLQGFEGVGKITHKGGSLSASGNQLVVKDADEVLLLVRIEPSYDFAVSKEESLKKALNDIADNYELLLQKHSKIHGELFNRVKLNLGGNKQDADLDAEIAIQTAKTTGTNHALIEKQFDAARYNIICATGTNPPNLQGIWNGTWSPPWSSDYTQDGNLEVAVSSMLSANMPELLLPLFTYQEKMLPYYRDNALNLYGCRGIQVPSRSSTHGWNIHFSEGWPLTFWNAGAGWIASYYFDYWLYTGDLNFLRNRAFPFMKEAALFYEDFLTLGTDGKYVFNPSYSPENTPLGFHSQTCINATMDIAVAKQLFRHCIEAGKILKEDDKTIAKWEVMLKKLPAYEVNEDGALREWLWPGLKDNYAHRHVSHLYGLFGEVDPEIAGDPKLVAACKRAVEERMKIRRTDNGGEMVFGLVNLAWATENIGDRDMTKDIINWLSSQYWTNGMATYHNPGGLFNMDLSGGFPSVIINSLVYSEPGLISLLPAKPETWPKGSIDGVLLRGQLTMKKLVWDTNKITLVLYSPVSQAIHLKVPGKITDITAFNAKIQPSDKSSILIPEKQEVTLNIAFK